MDASLFTRLDSISVVFPEGARRSHCGRLATLLGWPVITLLLILAKLVHSLNWPWIMVLAPICLPVLIFSILLIGAMWLDQLNT